MFHPARFPSGSAHVGRRDLLRDLAALLKDLAAEEQLTFDRWEQQGKRGMYVLNYAGRDYGLEKSQVELVAFGILLGLLASRTPVSKARLNALIERVQVRLPDGTYPGMWTHEPQTETPEPPPPKQARKKQ